LSASVRLTLQCRIPNRGNDCKNYRILYMVRRARVCRPQGPVGEGDTLSDLAAERQCVREHALTINRDANKLLYEPVASVNGIDVNLVTRKHGTIKSVRAFRVAEERVAVLLANMRRDARNFWHITTR
jgi:hypothetical protein